MRSGGLVAGLSGKVGGRTRKLVFNFQAPGRNHFELPDAIFASLKRPLDIECPMPYFCLMMITVQNARQMAARSLEARRASKQAALERENLLKRLLAAEENRLLQAAENPVQRPVNAPDDAYLAERLARVRKQIAMLDVMLEGAAVASEVDKFASALCRLSELARQLSGRPLPGSLRPQAPRTPKFTFSPPVDA